MILHWWSFNDSGYEGRIVNKTRAGHREVRTLYDTEEVVEDNPGKSFKRY